MTSTETWHTNSNATFWEMVRLGNTADYLVGEAIYPGDSILNGAVGPYDWGYDDYDQSLELKGCPTNWEPDQSMLARFSDMDVCLVFVSRDGCKADDYAGASLWVCKGGQWIKHANGCSQRTAKRDLVGLWRNLKKQAKEGGLDD